MTVERRFSNIGHTHYAQVGTPGDWWDKMAWIRADGVMEIGRYIDFHNSDTDTSDYTFRMENDGSSLLFSGALAVTGTIRTVGTGAAVWFEARDAGNEGFAWWSPDGYTGYLWSDAGEINALTITSGGSLTATNIEVTNYLRVGFIYAGGFGSANTANTFYSDGYGSVKFGIANTSATGYPVLPDNANFVISYESHGGGYGRQFFYPDNEDMYTRLHQAGSWATWHKMARHAGSGYLLADTADAWTTSGWGRALSLRTGAAAAIQFYDSTRHWGIGTSVGILYFMHTTSDTNAAPAMTYSSYVDGTTWTFTLPVVATNLSIASGYGVHLNGTSGTIFLADNTASSYTSLRIGGSKGGYSGFYAAHSAMAYMWDSSGNGGPYHEGYAQWYYYHTPGNNSTGFGGTDTSASYKIYVTGSAYATGTWTASDARKKENVVTIPSALDKVASMRGVYYNWRADAKVNQDPDIRHLGLLAQEVQEVLPEAVHYAEDVDSYAVDYNGLIGLLIEAVKELKEKYEQAH